MSKRYTPHFGADPSTGVRVLCMPANQKAFWADGNTVPTDGKAGYEPGCIFQKTNGSAGATLFINEGTALSCDFNPIRTSSNLIVPVTSSTLTLTEALHNNRTMVLDLAGGIAITLPAAAAGLKFRFLVKTTFTGAASIKSVTGADIMIGHALMGNNTDNTVVDWQSVASSTNDTIDLFGTANSTGGIEGQEITIEGLGANLWFVTIRGDAAGSEATPFANTVA